MAQDELERTAKQMVEKPRGILAIDESTPTMEKRLKGVGLESTEESRRAYREMLITTQNLGKYISGAILFEETLYQKTDEGQSFVDILEKQGIIPGIKVDKGTKDMENFPGEKITDGLDGLRERLIKYKEGGARFAKWRAVLSIDDGKPTGACIEANAQTLAKYAALCQEQGLVPIVEPEVLMDGKHAIKVCLNATQKTLGVVFDKLSQLDINFKGMILKPNMVVPGKDYPNGDYSAEIARQTVKALQSSVPEDVPGIAFLSGGLSDEDATNYLSVMNLNYSGKIPWNLTFSFGRALQRKALDEFAKNNNIPNAQEKLIKRAEETSLATVGKYKPQ